MLATKTGTSMPCQQLSDIYIDFVTTRASTTNHFFCEMREYFCGIFFLQKLNIFVQVVPFSFHSIFSLKYRFFLKKIAKTNDERINKRTVWFSLLSFTVETGGQVSYDNLSMVDLIIIWYVKSVNLGLYNVHVLSKIY